MRRHHNLKSLFLFLIITSIGSSCGLIEKFKTPEQPTESNTSDGNTPKDSKDADALLATNIDTKTHASDGPSNITTENLEAKEELSALLNDDFAGKTPKEKVETIKVEEAIPEIKPELPKAVVDNTNSDAGKVMNYKVQKGETLMQIAFKIYGDISKWKEIQQMNEKKFSKNSNLQNGMELKYKSPVNLFVWNPEGTPYMIKTGETLGIISNSVYQTPNKWKQIWENNKPLIKNPNVIYAGFTVYYKNSQLASARSSGKNNRKVASKAEEN